MLLREAVTPEPDYPFARRVALFAGVLTAGVIASTIAVVVCSRHEARAAEPEPVPTIVLERADLDLQHFVSFRTGPADPNDVLLAEAELAAYATVANGRCPRDMLVLNAMMPKLHAVDPWGNPYQVACNAGVAFRSAGPDRRFDTSDDLWR